MDADSRLSAARAEPTAAAAGAGRDEQVTTAANDAGMPQASAMTSGGRARAPTLGPSAPHERTESAAVEHVGKSSAEPSQTREFSSDALQPRPVSAVARHAGKSSQERPADETSADGHQPRNPFRHWLATVNTAVGVFLLGALAAPMFDVLGWQAAAGWLYAAYHFTCHEWAFRSFFLFGTASPLPIAVYAEDQLVATTADPFGFIGNADLGWKMAFCERDLAIYVGLLAVGLLYARRRHMRPASFGLYAVLILPMALDGFTQLFGWRESTWELRVGTGLLFGLASAWLVLPRLDASFGLEPAARQNALSATSGPQPAVAESWTKKPWINLSSRG